MIEDKPKKTCKYCRKEIDKNAKVCYQCGKYQRWYHNSPTFNWLTILLSFLLLILAIFQHQLAKREKGDANEALINSKAAIDTALHIQKNLIALRDSTYDTFKFHLTAINAQNDDRASYDSLKKWSQISDYKYKVEAEEIFKRIKAKLEEQKSDFGSEPNIPGIKISTINYQVALSLMEKHPSNYRIEIVRAIGYGDTEVSDAERLEFLFSVLENDQSLVVVEWAGLFLKELLKIDCTSLDVDCILKYKNLAS